MGTATVLDRSDDTDASLTRIADVAAVEKPLPPHSLGILRPKKPWRRMKAQASGLKSLVWSTSKSSTMPQSSSHSAPRNASSSAVRPIFGVYVSRRLSSLGAPEKMSRSKPTVPQPRATRSVSEIFGMSFFAAL